MSKYKFYLSFENSNCRGLARRTQPPPTQISPSGLGYVSEKLPKAFIWNLVPIVGGPKDYLRHSPTSHSSIWTENFPTAQACPRIIR